eukprot:CAMPEP_0114671292 /NCGR_PEP_ID=MMETSP0191-20121206/40942_1 /TAXON_ID=126664 /ORGANISM="Sorites sp." /LENGTH=156 /DNA_ID=CAMNT_0001930849 /DNA_START=390 /DNA_END=857 /DNA_ORIENTATION=+
MSPNMSPNMTPISNAPYIQNRLSVTGLSPRLPGFKYIPSSSSLRIVSPPTPGSDANPINTLAALRRSQEEAMAQSGDEGNTTDIEAYNNIDINKINNDNDDDDDEMYYTEDELQMQNNQSTTITKGNDNNGVPMFNETLGHIHEETLAKMVNVKIT